MRTVSAPQTGVYLGLGANLGDRRRNLAFARNFLNTQGIEVIRSSSLYLTQPVGVGPQPPYLNQVIQVRSCLPPAALLEAGLAAEQAAGRLRRESHGARVLDVDLLLHGLRICRDPGLILPHPRLHLRRFVLAPLAEIAPDAWHPGLKQRVAGLLRRCADRSSVVRLPGPMRLVPGRLADL